MVLENNLSKNGKRQNEREPILAPNDVSINNVDEPSKIYSNTRVKTALIEERYSTSTTANAQRIPQKKKSFLNLKNKATALAIALSTLPVVLIGATAYYFANRAITKQTNEFDLERTNELAEHVNHFMHDAYKDIQLLSKLPALAETGADKVASLQEKRKKLDVFQATYPIFESIALFDLKGNVIVQSTSLNPVRSNFFNQRVFQEVLKVGYMAIGEPKVFRPADKITEAQGEALAKQVGLEIAAPIKEPGTGRLLGVLRGFIPSRHLEEKISYLSKSKYHLVNAEGDFFISAEKFHLGLPATHILPEAPELLKAGKTLTKVWQNHHDNSKELIYYVPLEEEEGWRKLNWAVLLTVPEETRVTAQRQLLLTITIGTGITALIVGLIAAYLANRATTPVLEAAQAVQKLGEGELDTRVNVAGEDELATLGSNINLMAEQIQDLLNLQAAAAQRSQSLADITIQIRKSLKPKSILNTAVKELKQALNTDRVIVYSFDTNWDGKVVAESVAPGWTQTLGLNIKDTCLSTSHGKLYKDGRVRAINNIYQAGLTDCHIKMLEQFEVKSNLVVPIRVDNQLFGLLIAQQCSEFRDWLQPEIELFTEVAVQIGITLSQAKLLRQLEQARQQAEVTATEQRQQKEAIQLELIELLSSVEGATRGDLTVRADVTAGEIGTVADFFNAVVESLRQIVTQVKQAATQVNVSLGTQDDAMRQLANQAMQQAEEITSTLDSVEKMTQSIQQVAANARKAAEVARSASVTAVAGGTAMDKTVESILHLRETVAETAKKVKRLGESSQQISKVVSLINQIALQTNLLAINASIEAARAGEEGRGFAVVAEEVGELAAKSAAATKEIEQIVENIQQETNEVTKAMELGTSQVVEGTNLVADAKKSLGKIVEVSQQIDRLVQSISTTTVSQAETSEAIAKLMKQIATISERTSDSSRQVSHALQETVEVAQQLQDSVGQFKVAAEI